MAEHLLQVAVPRTFSDGLRALRGGHSTRPFCNLFKLLKLGRLVVSKKCDNDIMKITQYQQNDISSNDMQRVGLNLYLQHLKSDLQRLNLQIHKYFLSRTCRKMHECLGAKKQPKVAISQCSKNLLLGEPNDHCQRQAPHSILFLKTSSFSRLATR